VGCLRWLGNVKRMPGHSGVRAVVVGARFGGLEATKSLTRLPVQITVVNHKNHPTFQPLLHQIGQQGCHRRKLPLRFAESESSSDFATGFWS